jgi:molybdate transport system ATP-binding protein
MPPEPQEATPTLAVQVRLLPERAGDFDLDVAFEAGPGITILFGPSGAGKSTTLAAIAGLRTPDQGRIALGDEVWLDTRTRRTRAIHERGVALVFQSSALFPHLTARANVEYGIDRGVARAERQSRALAMLARMKVAHLAERKPRSFSGGEAQRVALARAFARAPRLLLLDEAFSSMDRELRLELLAEVRTQLAELAIPTLMVTHLREEARLMGERVVRLAAGRVAAVGSVEALLGDGE